MASTKNPEKGTHEASESPGHGVCAEYCQDNPRTVRAPSQAPPSASARAGSLDVLGGHEASLLGSCQPLKGPGERAQLLMMSFPC